MEITKNMINFERYRLWIQDGSHPATVGRYAHWAIAATLDGGLTANDLIRSIEPYTDRELALHDRSRHTPHSSFELGSVAMERVRGHTTHRILLPNFYGTGDEFVFRLDPEGQPAFEVYADTGY